MRQNIKVELEAQEDIGEAYRKAYRFFNLSLDMLVISNLDGYFINVNPAWERSLGFTLEELRTQPFLEFVHPEDWAKTTAEMGKKLAEGLPVTDFENRYRCKDGSYKYLAWTAVPFLEEGLIYAVARDLTDRKQTEAALRENQRLLQEIVDAAPMDIFLKDVQGKYILINRSGEITTGLGREQVIGKTDYDLFPAEIADAFQANDSAVLEAGKPVESEEFVSQADGQHTVIAIKFPLYDSSGAPYAICEFATDITQRKRAEEALYQREQSFRALAENAPDIITRFDKQMRHLYVNAAVEAVTGLAPQAFIGKTNRELGMPDFLCSYWEENYQQVLTTGCERIIDFDFPTPDGTTRHYQTRMVPEFALDGSVESMLTVARDVTKFKETEKALRENQQLLEALLDAAPMAIYLKDLQGRFLLCNRYCLASLGLSSEQLIGKSVYNFYLPEIADLFQVSDRATLEAGGPVEFEEAFAQPDGIHTYITTKFPLYDAAGNPYAVCGISVEITKRKQAETALFESEERFRQLAENIDAVVWIWAIEEQETLYLSPAYEKIWGRSSKLVFENFQNWLDTIYPEDRDKISTIMYQRLIQGHFVEETYRIIKPDGSVRWINDRAFPIYNSQGKLYRAAGISEDITERILTEAALKASEQKYRNLVETSQGLIWSLDTEGRLTFVNQVAQEFSGYKSEEIIGKKFSEFTTSTTPEQAQKKLEIFERLYTGESILQYEGKGLRKDGTQFWLSCNMMALRDDTGNILGITGTAVDITERKKAEEQLKLSLQEKEALIKEVHHRVKNNLQVISSLLDLQSQQIQDPVTLELFRASQNRVKSIALIHEKLYQSDNLARVNLAEYIQSLTSYLLHTYPIDPNNITLQLQVKQIFLNLDIVIPCGLIINELVSNALKHGFPGNTKGTIWVCLSSVCLASTEKKGQQFTLVIGNNGMKLQDNQKFYRPKSLGFQLVNALVKQLQGTIEITPSPGTEFKIKFSDINH